MKSSMENVSILFHIVKDFGTNNIENKKIISNLFASVALLIKSDLKQKRILEIKHKLKIIQDIASNNKNFNKNSKEFINELYSVSMNLVNDIEKIVGKEKELLDIVYLNSLINKGNETMQMEFTKKYQDFIKANLKYYKNFKCAQNKIYDRMNDVEGYLSQINLNLLVLIKEILIYFRNISDNIPKNN